MDQRIVDFFRNAPGALPLYEEAAKMIIEKTSDLDEELRSWLVMAYAFSTR